MRNAFTRNEMSIARDVLLDARELLETPGVWRPGETAAFDRDGHAVPATDPDAVRWSLTGAIRNAAYRRPDPNRAEFVAGMLVRRTIAPGVFTDQGPQPYGLTDWAYTPGRTLDDVLGVLDTAIVIADRKCGCGIASPAPDHTLSGCVCVPECECTGIAHWKSGNARRRRIPRPWVRHTTPAHLYPDYEITVGAGGREFIASRNVDQSAYDPQNEPDDE